MHVFKCMLLSHVFMVYELRFIFGVLWSDGMDRNRVANLNEKLVKPCL